MSIHLSTYLRACALGAKGKMNKDVVEIRELTFDLGSLEYISSAGLRVLLSLQKTMKKQGLMLVKNVSEEVQEIFEVTGFSDIFTIE